MNSYMLVNFDALERQYAGHRHQILEKMFKTFVSSLDLDLLELKNGLSQGEAAKAGQAAHSIAGAASVLGLELLRKTALNLETLIQTGDIQDARAALGELSALVTRSVEELAEYINRTHPSDE